MDCTSEAEVFSFFCLICFGLGVWLRRAKGYEAFENFQVRGLLAPK